MDATFGADDLEFYAEHFDYLNPHETALRDQAIGHLSSKCPVTHSDAWGGFWVVNGYEEVSSVYLDWTSFSSDTRKRITPLSGRPMPPIDLDPPIQQAFRKVLNPLLTPRRVAVLEPDVRAFVTELIDAFIDDGHCDLAEQFSRPFPARMLYRFLFGIDDADVPLVMDWTETMLRTPGDPRIPEIKAKWFAWICDMFDQRRSEPRRPDLVDGLLYATIDGRPITDEERVGCVENLILGGFSTTNDTIANSMLRMAERPELQARLRENPALINTAIDEFLRFDSPVARLARLCTRDTVVGDQEIKAGERLWMFLGAANRDEDEFTHPNEIDIDRPRNRHIAFGIGPHRCVGSNVGRLNVRIALEELLSRLGPFEVTSGMAVERAPSPAWGIDHLPLSFTPPARRASAGA